MLIGVHTKKFYTIYISYDLRKYMKYKTTLFHNFLTEIKGIQVEMNPKMLIINNGLIKVHRLHFDERKLNEGAEDRI